MGGKQTKFENEIPESSGIQPSAMDPRSPNGQRTPINLPALQRVDTLSQLVHNSDKSRSSSDNPSPCLNRTPLVFEDSSDKTLNLDDTFADLFVESNVPDQIEESNSCNDYEMAECTKAVTESSQNESKVPATPVALLQQQFDPRSPSIGVERTPIIFNDDEQDANEDLLLEHILTTLTLKNLNVSDSSCVSIKSSDNNIKGEEEDIVVSKPANRHLDRLRANKKAIPKRPHRRQKRVLRQKIYEDLENQLYSTPPKMKKSDVDGANSPKTKRTPLSCVRNSAQLRSRSVESSAKSMKTHLPIMSFDDTLNPNENKKVPKFRVMEGSIDSAF